MITIPANNSFLNYKIDVDNYPNNPAFPEDYILELPHTYGSNKTFKTVIAEVIKSQDFTGNVSAELFSSVKDLEEIPYEKPALYQQVDSSETVISLLNESTEGTYRLMDSTAERLIFRVTQVTPGTGKIIFVIRGL